MCITNRAFWMQSHLFFRGGNIKLTHNICLRCKLTLSKKHCMNHLMAYRLGGIILAFWNRTKTWHSNDMTILTIVMIEQKNTSVKLWSIIVKNSNRSWPLPVFHQVIPHILYRLPLLYMRTNAVIAKATGYLKHGKVEAFFTSIEISQDIRLVGKHSP